MIVLDTTILVYATGNDHPLREPCRRLVAAISEDRIQATTTPEVIQEFVHVRARRKGRADAAQLGTAYAEILAPLLIVQEPHLSHGLRLFVEHDALGAFDAVLAAAAMDSGAEALVSADEGFGSVRDLRHLDPTSRELVDLLGHS